MHLKVIVLSVFSLIIALTFNSCSDNSQRTFYDKKLKQQKLNCLKFIPKKDDKLEQYLSTLYHFDKNCKYLLTLSYKSDIVCHSTYNVPQKVNLAFPSAFINLEVRNGMNLEYSYYKDLTHQADKDDVKDAFEALKDDILKK
jgi:hypothetical protein